MSPYLRAAAKFPAMRARPVERLGKRPDRLTRLGRPDRPVKPPQAAELEGAGAGSTAANVGWNIEPRRLESDPPRTGGPR
jgi:hypothetical protein